MNFSIPISFFVLIIFLHKVDANTSLTFGDATLQSPGVTLKAVNDGGRLVQTITWTVQVSQCEVLTRTDESINLRARLISLTSTCINKNVCQSRGPITTPITCDEFMRRLN